MKNALVSVFDKEGLEPIVRQLDKCGITIFSTGGTQKFIEDLGINVVPVEGITSFPSILGGRVKTLHPRVFGGILGRRDLASDVAEMDKYEIPPFDYVVVDLYPFEQTVAEGKPEDEIIEKIDIGGISLIRAAAKNFQHVMIIPSKNEYGKLLEVLENENGESTLELRKELAKRAFEVSSNYDTQINAYFTGGAACFNKKISGVKTLRYGENPHQKAAFYGNLDDAFTQIHGKELSYNNLLDIDAAFNLISEFNETTFAVIKHNNACGLASRATLIDAWKDALAGDPVSAFGGILITNAAIDEGTAKEINNLFFEVLIAPSYEVAALDILKQKKNRMLLVSKPSFKFPAKNFRSLLSGVVEQDRDWKTDLIADMRQVSKLEPSSQEKTDLEFANKIVKHLKSNTIVLAKNKQLLAAGTGQTSRVDALKQAIEKAGAFGFDLKGSVMASDAFFPFPDCVEIAHNAGITSVIHPGGSINDDKSIAYCDNNNMSMVLTGTRHFKH